MQAGLQSCTCKAFCPLNSVGSTVSRWAGLPYMCRPRRTAGSSAGRPPRVYAVIHRITAGGGAITSWLLLHLTTGRWCYNKGGGLWLRQRTPPLCHPSHVYTAQLWGCSGSPSFGRLARASPSCLRPAASALRAYLRNSRMEWKLAFHDILHPTRESIYI